MKNLQQYITESIINERNDFYPEDDLRNIFGGLNFCLWDEDDSDCLDELIKEISKKIGIEFPEYPNDLSVDNPDENSKSYKAYMKERAKWISKAKDEFSDEEIEKIWDKVGGRYTDKHAWGMDK